MAEQKTANPTETEAILQQRLAQAVADAERQESLQNTSGDMFSERPLFSGAEETPRPKKVKHKPPRGRSPYRNGALLVTGLICCALLLGGATLLWGVLAYYGDWNVAESTAVPLLIFLGALFLAAALTTALSRGGTIYPSLALCLLSCSISFLLAGTDDIKIGGILLKLLLSLVVCVVSFTLVKLHYLNKTRG